MKCQKTMTPATTAAVHNREEDPRRDPGSQNARDRSHRRRRIPAGDLFPPRTSHRIPRSASASASPLAFTLHHHHGSMPKPQLKTSAWAYPSIHAPRGGSPLPRLSLSSLALVFLSSPTEPPPPRFHPTRKQEFVVKFPPCVCFCGFPFLPLPCSYGPLIRGFVDLGKRRCGRRPAAIWRGGYGRREGADRGQVPALRRHGHRAHQVRSLHHSLLAQGVHPRSVAAR